MGLTPVLGVLVSLLPGAVNAASGPMQAALVVEGQWLSVDMEAPAPGWLAVGFSPRPGMNGVQFYLGRVVNGSVEVQAHVAVAPPVHQRVADMGEDERVEIVGGGQRGGRTRIRFRVHLGGPGAHALHLRQGQKVYVMLAYSHSPDFDHHSAMRNHVVVTL